MIRVLVFKRSGRRNFEAQWVDPVSRRKRTRSTGTSKRREAERFAARLEQELNEGTFRSSQRLTWAELRRRYEAEALLGKADKTVAKDKSTLNKVEEILAPKLVASLDANAISRFRRKLYEDERAGYTIKGHLAILRKVLRWAQRHDLIVEVPTIDMPKKVAAEHRRPPTTEEFERILSRVPEGLVGLTADDDGRARKRKLERAAEIPEATLASWRFVLEGLWWSGLRLAESERLHWTNDRKLRVDLSGRRPMFRIQATAEKGRKFRLLPMAPEFAEQLERVPESERRGCVFDPVPLREPFDVRLGAEWVGKVLSRIGEAAGVLVTSKKFASAHDLRRAFGFRWSQRVLPPVLMELMRHESIQTTMKYYVGRNAEIAADTVWEAWSGVANNSANSPDSETETSSAGSP